MYPGPTEISGHTKSVDNEHFRVGIEAEVPAGKFSINGRQFHAGGEGACLARAAVSNNIGLAQLRDDLFALVLLLGHSNVLAKA